jgi:hypothetical protein
MMVVAAIAMEHSIQKRIIEANQDRGFLLDPFCDLDG